ncbi:hypothetical protein [Aquimarina longa]|uniref:hypothetical protein n=1 Tax=Aquimarina longa TaxID=1080221 RepID=UPI000780BC5D|nr:hypothetical protein [Aquimarina longa]
MKVIEDEDLLSLHDQIEKSEIKQKRLEDLLDKESEKLKKSKKSNRIYGIFLGVLFIVTIFFIFNAFYYKKHLPQNNIVELSLIKEELESAQEELEKLKKEKINLKEISNLYLYRKLINKDTVYSVQLKAFYSKEVPLISEKYINALIYSDTSYYKMSLGIFETLSEAQVFRKTLITSGFSKKIFVISYKDGKRIKIENFQ